MFLVSTSKGLFLFSIAPFECDYDVECRKHSKLESGRAFRALKLMGGLKVMKKGPKFWGIDLFGKTTDRT